MTMNVMVEKALKERNIFIPTICNKSKKIILSKNLSFSYLYPVNQKFPKNEKIKSRKTIDQLFSEGKSWVQYPVKMLYIPSETEVNQAAFSVPKRNFKRAVDRNRIKRKLREAYRLNKYILSGSTRNFSIFFIYLGKEKREYRQIEKSVKKLLFKLKNNN